MEELQLRNWFPLRNRWIPKKRNFNKALESFCFVASSALNLSPEESSIILLSETLCYQMPFNRQRIQLIHRIFGFYTTFSFLLLFNTSTSLRRKEPSTVYFVSFLFFLCVNISRHFFFFFALLCKWNFCGAKEWKRHTIASQWVLVIQSKV